MLFGTSFLVSAFRKVPAAGSCHDPNDRSEPGALFFSCSLSYEDILTDLAEIRKCCGYITESVYEKNLRYPQFKVREKCHLHENSNR